MLSRIRVFPVVILLLFMTFTVRLGDFIMELASGQNATLQPAVAMAEEEKKPEAKKEDAAKKGDKKDDKKDAAPRGEIPVPSADATKETEVKGLEEDPFSSGYSDEEVKVLQSLSKRREQLEQRERDLDQREKLLQAAEKKVDEKLTEMNTLKSSIETLLQKQQKLQDERLNQLVKIYENMKPKDAANIFNEMQFDVLLGIIDKMSERKVAPILAAMDPAKAREVSARLAEQRALPQKPDAAQDDQAAPPANQ